MIMHTENGKGDGKKHQRAALWFSLSLHTQTEICRDLSSSDSSGLKADMYCASLLMPYMCVCVQKQVRFWFATGGAGFCLSRGLALKMKPWAR